jgi:hypothetical protein
MVLCSSANQSNTSYIDFLYSLRNGDVNLCDSVFKGIEIADNEVDLIDILFCKVLFVGGKVASEDTSVNLGNYMS